MWWAIFEPGRPHSRQIYPSRSRTKIRHIECVVGTAGRGLGIILHQSRAHFINTLTPSHLKGYFVRNSKSQAGTLPRSTPNTHTPGANRAVVRTSYAGTTTCLHQPFLPLPKRGGSLLVYFYHHPHFLSRKKYADLLTPGVNLPTHSQVTKIAQFKVAIVAT